MDREKSDDYNDIYFMAFALKGKELKIVKEKVEVINAASHAIRN